MAECWDVVVVGLGVMGLATVYQAKKANPKLRVLGLEQFDLLHDKGSSHGESRLTRQAYSEGVMYVPLMLDAHREWDALGKAAGKKLLHRSGVVYVSHDKQGEVIQGALRSAKSFSLPGVTLLDAEKELDKKIVGMKGEAGEVALWEEGGGWLEADSIRLSLERLSREMGVEMRFNNGVTGWKHESNQIVSVTLANGQVVRGKALVLTAGCWTQRMVPGLTLHPRRAVLSWFEVEKGYEAERAAGPGFMLERKGQDFIYGFPALQQDGKWLLKCAWHYAPNLTKVESPEPDCDADTVRREVDAAEVAGVEKAVKSLFRGLGKRVKSKTCLYNNSADCHFVIDTLPEHRNVVVASGFSGHGFKFAITVGKIVSRLAQGLEPGFDISAFRLVRPDVFAKL